MWFYAKDGRKVGPVSDGELDSLTASGVIDAFTLVWREGMAEWQPLATARPGVLIPKVGQEACSQCGTFHSPDDLVVLSGLTVCGACKPAVVQRIKEGLPFTNLDNAWRDRASVVASKNAHLPKRCFWCNCAGEESSIEVRLTQRFSVNRTAKIRVHLCSGCKDKRRRSGFIAIAAGAIGFLSLFVLPVPFGGGTFFILLVGVAPFFAYRTQIASCRKISADSVWFSGAGRPFLDSLPKWPN